MIMERTYNCLALTSCLKPPFALRTAEKPTSGDLTGIKESMLGILEGSTATAELQHDVFGGHGISIMPQPLIGFTNCMVCLNQRDESSSVLHPEPCQFGAPVLASETSEETP